ncbi:MAG: transporter substrate-binding domain-containing protein [Clostridia bacterium]|nr:transporter substrate-binding domain-containing protein [Clostridia bacterium]
MKKGVVKALAVCGAAIMATAALTACGNQARNKVILGTNAAFPPFEYTTTNGLVGEFDGIDVAIAKKIAEADGKELQINDMEFDGLISAVSTGKIDMAVAGMTVTDERKQNVDFSDTYYVAAQVMVVAADNEDIKSAEDIKKGKKVGVVIGYTGDSLVTEMGVDDNNITRANRGIDIVQDVKNGKLDAVVIDSATGKALAEANGLKVVEDPKAFETEEYAIAVKKGNKELVDKINKVLADMKKSGEIEKLAVKYNSETTAK